MPYRTQQQVDFRDKDLFALVGPTGSGKSALLDAITFAFYGKTPRWQESRPGKELITQGQSRLTVEIEFQVKGRIYQVIRSAKRKGSPEAQLRHFQEGEFRPMSAERRTSTQVTEDLIALLGMDYATFTKTLMLPQGQFDRLLKPKEPRERKELLIQLAGLSVYDRVGERLAQRLKPLELQMRELEGALGALPEIDEARLQSLENGQLQAQLEVERSQQSLELCQQRSQRLQLELGWLRDLQSEQQRVSEGESQQGSIDELRDRLESSARVESQQGHLQHLDQLRTHRQRLSEQIQECQARFDTDQQSLQEATEGARQAEQEAARLPALEERRASLLRLQESLTTYAESEREIAGLGLDSLLQQHASQQAELDQLGPELKAVQSSLESLSHQLAELSECVPLAQWRAAWDGWQQWQKSQREYQQGLESRHSLEQALDDLQAQQPLVEEQLEKCQREMQELRGRLEEHQRRQTGADLRRGLELDCPCPVCLQTVLRLPPATDDQDLGEPLRAQLLAVEARSTPLQSQKHALVAQIEVHQTQLLALKEKQVQVERESQELQQRYLRLCPGDQALEGAELEERLQAAEQQEQQRLAWREEVSQLQPQLARLQTATEVGRARLEATGQQLEQQRGRLHQLQERQAQRHQQLSLALKVESDFAAVAERRLHEVQQSIVLISHRGKEAEGKLQEAQALCRQSQQGLEMYRARQSEVAAELAVLEEQLEQVLLRLQLADERSLRDILLSGEERTRLQAQVEEHGQRLHAARQRVQSLLEQLGERRPSDGELSRALQEEAEARQRLDEQVRQQGALQEQLRQARQQFEKVSQLRSQHRAAEHRLGLHRKLSTMVSATGLKAYVANRLLQEILRLASSELERLSGRYQLKLKDDDILVVDGWNAGETRDVRSLSGGETFLASLSLALAMVEYLAQGSPLESLFIDEGFGTLDPETLEAVTQTLESLQAKGRLVGIITHVTELAERLPVQILVEKLQGQSHVRTL